MEVSGLSLTEPAKTSLRCLIVLFLVLPLGSCNSQDSSVNRSITSTPTPYHGSTFLFGNEPLQEPLNTLVYSPQKNPHLPADRFEGILSLDSQSAQSSIEVVKDTFGISDSERWQLSSLPAFSFEYVSDGDAIIPVLRKPQRGAHPYWEIIPGPGRIWSDPLDAGWSRASLPFTLKEKNQNCTHNGLMTFLYKADGSISRVAWQVGSETCLYLKINLWGITNARFQPRPIAEAESIMTDFHAEVEDRLEVRPISMLSDDYPAVDPLAFVPPGEADATVYGFVLDGVHYRSDCPTRYGPNPFCDVVDLPSYSLAKSIFAGLGYLLLIQQWPEFADLPVTALIPECLLEDDRWQGVTTRHLLNMNTGLFQSSGYQADEDSSDMETFFLAESHARKVRFSCEAWPKSATPGSVTVYHSTDHYLLGVAMNAFLKEKLGSDADIHRDLLIGRFLKDLDLSPVTHWSQRTYDEQDQPFVAFGLIFHSDDVVKIATSLNSFSPPVQDFDKPGFEAAMFRGAEHDNVWKSPHGKVAYQNGFWGFDAAEFIGCESSTWIPFMSGYGGIVVAMLPNNGVYYFFSDSNQHTFKNAAVEANKAINFCKES